MIAFLPNCGFLSEVSRAVEIARALTERSVAVAFAARGGPYAHLIEQAGFDLHRLDPAADPHSHRRFLDALLSMGPRARTEFYTDDELRAAVQAERAFLQDIGAAAAVTGFTLTAYLSTRLAGVPLVTDHGGSFVPPVLAAGLCPVPIEVDTFLNTGEPVVFVCPTTVTEALLRALVSQAQTTGARVLVGATVHDVGDLADDRTLIAGVLPNHLVMPRVAAAVIMGGQGSVQTAMAAGTPFVGLPYHGEQELNVAVAERLGMAIRMPPASAETGKLAPAIRRLLDEPSFRASAAGAARHYDGVDGAATAADVILAWLGERAVPAGHRPRGR